MRRTDKTDKAEKDLAKKSITQDVAQNDTAHHDTAPINNSNRVVNKDIISLESQEKARVTYSELADNMSHFEIAFLSFQKAIEIIRSAVFLHFPEQKTKYKPKVAVVALEKLCSNPQEAVEFKEVVQKQMFEEHADSEKDSYNVDEGHLPKNGDSAS